MEVFLTRGWDIIIPGFGRTLTLARGAILPRAGSMSSRQLVISRLGWGFHTVRSGIDPGDLFFSPRAVGFVDVWKDLPR